MITHPAFLLSPESALSDIRSLLDSYAVEVWKDGRLQYKAPIHSLQMYEHWSLPAMPQIDQGLEIKLTSFRIPGDDFLYGIREHQPRWPFYVEWPLTIVLLMGDQWWQYNFNPGKLYEDRTMEREAK